MNDHNEKQFTSSGTDIIEVKRQNAASGLTYNEVKELIAKSGGKGTAVYSDTNSDEIKMKNQ
ncbi:gamma-type small acid-soluble spore protein [Lysinibacillus sp. NPDC096418]|uniref:gamma-type small acid-soluble spore protein n=1 Tax=Lysinibacillus sp. NPDC096418 TaxID=3364138 RepID=UPI00381C4FA9